MIAHYVVTILDELRGVRVRVCFEGGLVRELVPIRSSAAPSIQRATGRLRFDGSGGRLLLDADDTGCAEYETRLGHSWLQPSSSPAIVTSQAQWLLRPHPFPNALRATVRFVLAEGQRVSVAWPYVDGAYRLEESAFFADTYAVFGKFARQSFELGGARLSIVRLGDQPSPENVARWLRRAVRTVSSIGHFPRDRVHVVITPADVGRDEVVFGMLRRGGGASILLIPSSASTREGLDRDWVAVHELSHLWLPRFLPHDRWLSEGIATYLQEVLRARCGLQSTTRAWQRLQEGFERGRRSGTGRTLASESHDMNRTGAFHRVYWAGAAFALEADLRLRDTTDGRVTLMNALGQAQQVWDTGSRPVTRSEFLHALQAPFHEAQLGLLGERCATRTDFPGIADLDSSKLLRWRNEIVKPDPGACSLNGESSR